MRLTRFLGPTVLVPALAQTVASTPAAIVYSAVPANGLDTVFLKYGP